VTRERKLSPQATTVLTALLSAPTDWHYGYELAKATGLQSGTLYPILIRLCEQGVLKATWRESDQPNRPPRHVYRLTARGLTVARELASAGRRGAALRSARAAR
jgi:DNA-binding PadR family transcriptional regulator